MFTHNGGETVKGGFYWNRRTWRLEMIENKSGTLPGDGTTRYLWVPTLLMLLLAPVMGGLFVVFLPFIGFVLLFGAAGKWTIRKYRDMRGAAAHPAASVRKAA